MVKKKEHRLFSNCLLAWFEANRRDLPWRRTYDPYHVWISEIMLQQTQMERGVEYFDRWVSLFPDVRAVADADELLVLKAWEGLGYYSRARNIRKAAGVLVAGHDGRVPDDYDRLLALPGGLLAVASDSGYLCAFNQAGEKAWGLPLSSAITHLELVKGGALLAAGCRDGKVFITTPVGELVAWFDAGGRLQDMAAGGDELVIASAGPDRVLRVRVP